MSITIIQAEKNGLALESSICALGFPVSVAQAIAANYKTIVEGEALGSFTIPVIDGRADPLAIMLGMVETTNVETKAYSMGELEFAEGPDEAVLWVSNVDGVIRLSYTDIDSVEGIKAANGELDGHMASFAFPAEDLEEVLAALGTDLTDEANYVEYEG